MKKWSLKINSKKNTVANNKQSIKPKFGTDISIVHMLKLNFLPLIFLTYSIVVIIIVLLFLS